VLAKMTQIRPTVLSIKVTDEMTKEMRGIFFGKPRLIAISRAPAPRVIPRIDGNMKIPKIIEDKAQMKAEVESPFLFSLGLKILGLGGSATGCSVT
jgi:hypothetical protein